MLFIRIYYLHASNKYNRETYYFPSPKHYSHIKPKKKKKKISYLHEHKKITYQDQLKMQLQEPPTIVQTGNISKSPQHAAETLHEHHFIQESK